ncbi:MAG: enolase C-terminal domain-like protein, partial [Eubacteriaceae bacterium]
EELWEICAKVIQDAGYEGRAGIQMDVAADTYFDREEKLYRGLFSSKKMTKEELMKYYQKIVKNYPIVCIEDPFNEDDYEAHAELTSLLDIQIVGDDLFTTMKERVAHGASMGAANCVLLKVNQVGTITEALEMIQLAYKYGYGIMPCESRGEGVDIADYCVGINAGSVREQAIGEIGNRFLEIEQELGTGGKFIGKMGLKGKRFQTF